MSYDLELSLRPASWEEAERLAQVMSGDDCLSLVVGSRRRRFRDLPPSVHLDYAEAQQVLDDNASWEEGAFSLSERREHLARTVLRLGEEVDNEWTLRSSWVGDEVSSEIRVTPGELAELVTRSALRRDALYRVSRHRS